MLLYQDSFVTLDMTYERSWCEDEDEHSMISIDQRDVLSGMSTPSSSMFQLNNPECTRSSILEEEAEEDQGAGGEEGSASVNFGFNDFL